MRIVIIELIIGLLYLGVYLVIDTVVTHKRLRESQTAWDEYSKDMTRQERDECYFEWVKEQKELNGWRYCYFPNAYHIKPNVFKTKIDGVTFRGTKQEISEKSGVSLDLLESLDGMPLEIITKHTTG